MNASPESIRQLTRSYAALRPVLWLLLPFTVAPNLRAALALSGYIRPNGGSILMVAGVSAMLLAAFYRLRFGAVVPAQPEHWSQHPWHGLAGLIALAALTGGLLGIWAISGINLSEFGLLASSVAAIFILAASRGARRASWIVPVASCLFLSLTLTLPALQAYRAFAHLAMSAALIGGALQYHLFLVRGFEHARV